MFIQIQETPNPQALKFIPQTQVLKKGTFIFNKGESFSKSPLATLLFRIEGIMGLFYAPDFISVTKTPEHNWDVLKPQILSVMVDYFASGKSAVIDDMLEVEQSSSGEVDNEIVGQIKEIIETKVRPAVAQDGGDIIYKDFRDGIVYLELQGACSGCPSSTYTLKSGIENMLKHYVPEVKSVESV